MEKQICLSLVHQHLLCVSPSLLAEDFDDKYKPEKVLVKTEESVKMYWQVSWLLKMEVRHQGSIKVRPEILNEDLTQDTIYLLMTN